MEESIFTKIINKEASADIVFEDEEMIAIRDIRPKAPVHILLISKKPVESLAQFTTEDEGLLGRMMLRIAAIAREQKIEESGYKVVTNIGDDGGQIIRHFHIHLLGGSRVENLV
jgi:histidine triad (HIT) family protein